MNSIICFGLRNKPKSQNQYELSFKTREGYELILGLDRKNPNKIGIIERADAGISIQNKNLLKTHEDRLEKLFEAVQKQLNNDSSDMNVAHVCQSLMYGMEGNVAVEEKFNKIPSSDRKIIIEIFSNLLYTNYKKDNKFSGYFHGASKICGVNANLEPAKKTKDKIEELCKIILFKIRDTGGALSDTQANSTLSRAALSSIDQPVNNMQVQVQLTDKQYVLNKLIKIKGIYTKELEAAKIELPICEASLKKLTEEISQDINQEAQKISQRDDYQKKIKHFYHVISNHPVRIKELDNRIKQIQGAKVIKPLKNELEGEVAFRQLKAWQPKLNSEGAKIAFRGVGELNGTDDRFKRDFFAFGKDVISDPKDPANQIVVTNGTVIKFAGKEYKLLLPGKPETQNGIDTIRFVTDFIQSSPELIKDISESENPEATMSALCSLLAIGMRQCIGNVSSDVISTCNKQELQERHLYLNSWDYKGLVIDLEKSEIGFTNAKLLIKSPGIRSVEIPLHGLSFKVDRVLDSKYHMLPSGLSITRMSLNGQTVDLTDIEVSAVPSEIIEGPIKQLILHDSGVKIFQASPTQVNELRDRMFTLFLSLPEEEKNLIKKELIAAIVAKDIGYIPANDLIWESGTRSESVKKTEANILNKVFPTVFSLKDFQDKITLYLNSPKDIPEEAYKQALGIFIKNDQIHPYQHWVNIFCERFNLDQSQIELAVEEQHFYIKGKSKEFIPDDNNCAFHCIQYLFDMQKEDPISQQELSSLPQQSSLSMEEIDEIASFVVTSEDTAYTPENIRELQKTEKRQREGQLTGTEIFSIIKIGLDKKETALNEDITIENNSYKVIIKPHVTGAQEINEQLEDIIYGANSKDPSVLTLVPYGITNRTFGEDHSVLVAIYNKKVFDIDLKSFSINSTQINFPLIKKINKGLQSLTDSLNSGRYTAYTSIYLAKEFVKVGKAGFDIEKTLGLIKEPELAELQRKYAIYLETGNSDVQVEQNKEKTESQTRLQQRLSYVNAQVEKNMMVVEAKSKAFSIRATRSMRNLIRKIRPRYYFNTTILDLASQRNVNNLEILEELSNMLVKIISNENFNEADLHKYYSQLEQYTSNVKDFYNMGEIYYFYLRIIENKISPNQTNSQKLKDLITKLKVNLENSSESKQKDNISKVIAQLELQVGNANFDLSTVEDIMLEFFKSETEYAKVIERSNVKSSEVIKISLEKLKQAIDQIEKSINYFKTSIDIKNIKSKKRTPILIGLTILTASLLALHVCLPILIPITATIVPLTVVFAVGTTSSCLSAIYSAINSDRQEKKQELIESLTNTLESIKNKLEVIENS